MDTRSQPLQTNPSNASYRYGFNGKESDFEVKNIQGSQQDYGMRIYDPRLGKFLSVDPLTSKYPHYSPYHFAGNTPIVAIDLDGEEDMWVHYRENDDGTYTEVNTLYDVEAGQNQEISRMMNGANVPNTGVVYTFDHLDGSKSVRKIGETVVVSESRYGIVVTALHDAERALNGAKGTNSGESFKAEDWKAAGEVILGVAGGPLGFFLGVNAASEAGYSQAVDDKTGNSSVLSGVVNTALGNDKKDVTGKNVVTAINLFSIGKDFKKVLDNISKMNIEEVVPNVILTVEEAGRECIDSGENNAAPK